MLVWTNGHYRLPYAPAFAVPETCRKRQLCEGNTCIIASTNLHRVSNAFDILVCLTTPRPGLVLPRSVITRWN